MSVMTDTNDITLTPINGDTDVITKEFIQRALEKEANGDPVPEILSHSVTLGTKLGDNFMSIIYSVDVDLADGVKRHLIIKCYPTHSIYHGFINNSNMYFKEWEVYSKWIPELKRFQTEVLGLDKTDVVKLPYAHFVHGDCIDFQSEEGKRRKNNKSQPINSLENFIVMEDLRKTHGFRMADRREPLDLDHMRLVIQALAEVHSLSWAYRHHVESHIVEKFRCFHVSLSDVDLEIYTTLVNSNLEEAKEIFNLEFGPGNVYSAAADQFKPRVPSGANLFAAKGRIEGWEKFLRISTPDPTKFGVDAENPEPWRIICHGDCNNNNLMFKYDPDTEKPIQVALVDLQYAAETCVTNDLQYVIYCCTDLDFRRSHLDELLQLYHDTFNKVCAKTRTSTLPGFCMDSLRFRFHRAKFFGYYMAIMVLPIMVKEDDEAVDETELLCGDVVRNVRFKKRLIEVTKSMLEDGVL